MEKIWVNFDGQIRSHREHKGKYAADMNLKDYTVIDIETTGLDARFDEIIELGAVRYRNDSEVARFQSLVKPDGRIPGFITELTGITNEMVSNSPSIKDVLPEFFQFVGSDALLGHNVNFDINFIYDYTNYCGLPPFSNNYTDTMYLSRRLFKEERSHKLVDVCSRLNIPQPEEHRVIADCIRTHLCYQSIKQHCMDTNISISNYCETHAKHIAAQTNVFNEDGPIYQKVFAFTGTLEQMTRKEAMQAVVNCGGFIGDGVTKKTNFLVLGNNDYCKALKEGKSNKQKKAEKMQLDGFDIVTISEQVFYDMLQDSQLTAESTPT